MRTGELAQQAGVNIETLRYYERRGLLPEPERSANGYRSYGTSALERIQFIKRAQGLGFSLEEIEELMTLRPAKGRQRARVRRIAQAKLETIETKLAELMSIKSALERLVVSCEHGCDDTECPIIEALASGVPEPTPAGRKS